MHVDYSILRPILKNESTIKLKETIMHAFHFKNFHLPAEAFPFSAAELVYGCIAALVFILSCAIVIEKIL